MPTDDERREVARRLRRSRSEWSGMGWRLWLGPKFCAVVLSDGNRDELEDAAHRLADLIDPGEPKVRCVAEVKVDGERLKVTDDERREVARRLRGNPEDTLIPHRTGRHHGMGCREAADRFWNMCDRIKEAGNYDIAFSTTSILADLIEPSCDRDALLALASGLEADADRIIRAARNAQFGGGPRMGEAKHDAYEWRQIASRIREALGASDG